VANWQKVGVDLVMGGAAGGLDQWIQNVDEKRGLDERAAGTLPADKKLPVMKQYGTYLDYGVPLLSVIAVGMGWLGGDMATRALTIGGQLAGRKMTHQFTTGAGSNVPSAAYTSWQRQAALNAANRRAAQTTPPEFKGERTY